MSDPTKQLSDPTNTYPLASEDQWYCVQTTSTKENGTTYTPPSPSLSGTCRTDILHGLEHVDLSFDVTEAAGGTYSVFYTITYMSTGITASEVWAGIQKTINECNPS